jgi:hypothetical protein
MTSGTKPALKYFTKHGEKLQGEPSDLTQSILGLSEDDSIEQYAQRRAQRAKPLESRPQNTATLTMPGYTTYSKSGKALSELTLLDSVILVKDEVPTSAPSSEPQKKGWFGKWW